MPTPPSPDAIDRMKADLEHGLSDFVPRYMHEAIRAYVLEGQRTGNFLYQLFSNNLMKTFHAADDTNRANIHNYVRFLFNCVPTACHGSPAAVEEWQSHAGLSGINRLRQPLDEDLEKDMNHD